MPPKQQLSKADQKKLEKQKAEEERLKKEEEERIKAEKEEKKRQELERLRKLEEDRLAKEEAERLDYEYKSEVESQIIKFQQKYENVTKELKKKEQWNKFIECSEKPDTYSVSDIATYITQYQEEKQIKNIDDVESHFKKIQYSEEVINDLNKLLMLYKGDGIYEKVEQYNSYINQLRKITQQKIDNITSVISINADILIEEKILEQQKKNENNKTFKAEEKKIEITRQYADQKDIKYGIWINPNSKSGNRYKPIEFLEFGVQCEVPRQLILNQLIMRATWTSYDWLSKNVQQYTNYMVVGGILDIECYKFLQQPKKANGWMLKYDYEVQDSLKKEYYPALDAPQSQAVTSFRVTYNLPNYLYIHEDQVENLKVAVWDRITGNGWIQEPIEEIKYVPEEKQINFSSKLMAPFAFIQDRCVDFPYKQWAIRCIDESVALIDIYGQRLCLRFEIGPGYAKLIPKGKKIEELNYIYNQKKTTGQLLNDLLNSGINFLPNEKDALTANVIEKSRLAERNAIQDLILAIKSFYIKSSKWNQILSSEKIILRLKENLEYDEEFAEDQEKDWKSVIWWENKCGITQAMDSDENLNEKLLDNTVTHSTFEILLREHKLTHPEALERIRDLSSIYFSSTISRFFSLTKLLSFTTG